MRQGSRPCVFVNTDVHVFARLKFITEPFPAALCDLRGVYRQPGDPEEEREDADHPTEPSDSPLPFRDHLSLLPTNMLRHA